MQINLRPDLSSLNAHTLRVMKNNNEELKVLSGKNLTLRDILMELIGRYHPRKSLATYAAILNKELPLSLPIGESLADFVDVNQGYFQTIPELRKIFFRAEAVIVSGESILRLDFSKYVKDNIKAPILVHPAEELYITTQSVPQIMQLLSTRF